MSNNNKKNPAEAACYAAGVGVAATLRGMGSAVGGTSVAIVAAPVIAAGTVVELVAYGLKKIFD
ncbi:MAG: hypothetical protein V7K69_22375 [Nostoc sp.]|uniref:hypothetical protein n=1 Tax=Nostoc sp. TaxID=1180 RepID=UPI002FF4F124